MIFAAARLSEAISAVCPIISARVTGPASGEYQADPSATAQQITDANNALAAFDWSQAAYDAWLLAKSRVRAETELNGSGSDSAKVSRAIAAMLVDELNVVRQWLVSFKAEVAAATNLANLQSRVATLPTLSDRTLAQAKAAVQNKISSGLAD